MVKAATTQRKGKNMHINTDYSVDNEVRSMLGRDIQNLISEKSTQYGGIYEVGQRFVRATLPRDMEAQFAGYGAESIIRNWQDHALREVLFAVNNPDSQQATNLQTIQQMDWLQQFVLVHVPVDTINAVVSKVMSGTAGTGTQYLACYDILCWTADSMAREKTRAISSRLMADSFERQMEEARSFIKEQTLNHDGCDTGKRQFLEGTGLWDEDEVADMFSREHIITVNVTMQVTFEREIPGGEDPSDWASDHIASDDVERAVRDHLSSDYPDWEIEEVVPS